MKNKESRYGDMKEKRVLTLASLDMALHPNYPTKQAQFRKKSFNFRLKSNWMLPFMGKVHRLVKETMRQPVQYRFDLGNILLFT